MEMRVGACVHIAEKKKGVAFGKRSSRDDDEIKPLFQLCCTKQFLESRCSCDYGVFLKDLADAVDDSPIRIAYEYGYHLSAFLH